MQYLPDILMWLSWLVGYAVLLFAGLFIVSIVMVGLCRAAAKDRRQ